MLREESERVETKQNEYVRKQPYIDGFITFGLVKVDEEKSGLSQTCVSWSLSLCNSEARFDEERSEEVKHR